jgi:hypothetical protein
MRQRQRIEVLHAFLAGGLGRKQDNRLEWKHLALGRDGGSDRKLALRDLKAESWIS